MRNFLLFISIFLCFLTKPYSVYAQSNSTKESVCTMNEEQKEKLQFAYGFYKTYMNSLIYQLSDLYKMIAKKFVNPKVLKKTADADVDVLLDAQDCIEENVRTLQIKPIDKDWFYVSFLWPSFYDKVPSQKKNIYIKVKEQKNSFIIDDVSSVMPNSIQ